MGQVVAWLAGRQSHVSLMHVHWELFPIKKDGWVIEEPFALGRPVRHAEARLCKDERRRRGGRAAINHLWRSVGVYGPTRGVPSRDRLPPHAGVPSAAKHGDAVAPTLSSSHLIL